MGAAKKGSRKEKLGNHPVHLYVGQTESLDATLLILKHSFGLKFSLIKFILQANCFTLLANYDFCRMSDISSVFNLKNRKFKDMETQSNHKQPLCTG